MKLTNSNKKSWYKNSTDKRTRKSWYDKWHL